jgi:HK97 family phage prohead protease
MEYKAAPAFTMGVQDRTATGIYAVHGNVDSGGDRTYPGLFGDFTAGGRPRARFLWQHDSNQPPIAKIERIFEVSRADLPPAVLSYAPQATGGTAIERTYLDTPRASEVLAALSAGALTEMSYAYDPKEWTYTSENDSPVRELYKAELFDVSDVNWGMNPATSADGIKGAQLHIEHAMALATMDRYIKRYQDLASLRAKEGRVLSGENRKRITEAKEALASAIQALEDLLAATEPAKDIHALFMEFQRMESLFNGAVTP